MRLSASLLAIAAWLAAGVVVADPAAQLYQQHCQSCHGAERLGGTGPALLPESLARIKRAEALQTVQSGRPASQMAGFAQALDAGQIEALVDYLYQPPARPPTWNEDDIRASHRQLADLKTLPITPQHGADPLNLFVVVEVGSHHVVILDGDHFEPLARFPSHFALHGGPKFSPDGRFVYFASRDGWVSLYDLHNLTMVAEIRTGLNTRNLAVSSDGRWVLVGNYLPGGLVLLDRWWAISTRRWPTASSRASAPYTRHRRARVSWWH